MGRCPAVVAGLLLLVIGICGCRGPETGAVPTQPGGEVGATPRGPGGGAGSPGGSATGPDTPPRHVPGDSELWEFVGRAKGTVVRRVLLNRSVMAVEVDRNGVVSLYRCSAAVMLPDGAVLLAGLNSGLMVLRPNGEEIPLLKPREVGESIYLDSSNRYLAYSLPKEFDSEFVYKGGIGLYDLHSGQTRELRYTDPPGTFIPLGWLGQEVIFHEGPTPQTIRALSLDGTVRVVTELPRSIRRFLRMRGSVLVYEEVGGGVYIIDLQDLRPLKEFHRAHEPRWTEAGLEVLIDNQRQVVHSLPLGGGQ